VACNGCSTSLRLNFDFIMAFQPIYDVMDDCVRGYEALVRVLLGEGSSDALLRISPEQKYRFDQECSRANR